MENSKKTILVIDDEVGITQLLTIELEHEGYKTLVAHDGAEGFEQIKENKPDLIMLDIMMPGMDGYEMLQILKMEACTKDIPVILLTAEAHEKDIQRGKELGAAMYVTKPFDSIDLIKQIHQILHVQH